MATTERGTGTIVGRITDLRGKPIRGAIVTLLLKGDQFPDGEEHVRAELTDAVGRYRLENAPVGRIALKAYAPRTIYVLRVFEVADGATVTANFGLSDRRIPNPVLSAPSVTNVGAQTRLRMTQTGFSLDRNYTVAVNVDAGRVFELRGRVDANNETLPGPWTRTVPGRFTGRWIFFATDATCNTSDFLVVQPPPSR